MALVPVQYLALTEELEQLALDYQSQAQAILRSNGNDTTGRLVNSIKVQPARVEKGVVTIPITMLKYGEWVDNGAERKSGKQPPVQAIERWIKQKSISVPKQFKNITQFAWVIARAIGKGGQRDRRAYPFIQPALQYALDKNIQGVTNAVALDIITYTQKQLDQTSLKKK
tara:strand:- start:261 stop:770 length:510 start_codon:yes stop_codon:yes gene_type:complete